jgi:hypothetical protein
MLMSSLTRTTIFEIRADAGTTKMTKEFWLRCDDRLNPSEPETVDLYNSVFEMDNEVNQEPNK